VNYASLADNSLMSWQSNVDHWNIDYIELDQNRDIGDTVHNDIAFVSGAPSFLKRYSSMPFWQYRSNFVNEMNTEFEMLIANLDDEPHNASYVYHVYNPSGDIIETYNGGGYTLNPYYQQGYIDYDNFANPDVTLLFPFTTDSISFVTEHVLSSDASLSHRNNDTVRSTQTFSNYYAYDDGTAEAGYGLTASGAMLAYRFKLNDPDTLNRVKFFFNKTKNDATQQFFYITVWDDDNGKPGSIIYQSDRGVMPEYGQGLNAFTTYDIDPVPFTSKNATFYVGWQQTTSNILNIGFDFSRNSSEHIFYNTSGQWTPSRYQGSLMIRPVFGTAETPEQPEPGPQAGKLKISPNPARQYGTVSIQLPKEADEEAPLQMKVFSVTGKVIYSGNYSRELPLENFTQGVYIVRVMNPSGKKIYTNKFIITR
jgi:hypothetical protein